MEGSMGVRNMAMGLVVAVLFPVALSADNSGKQPACFERLQRDVRTGDSVSILMTDSVEIRGHSPMVNSSSAIIYLRLAPGSASRDMTIPFERVIQVSYRMPGEGRWALTLIGFGIGAAVGTAITTSDNDSISREDSTDRYIPSAVVVQSTSTTKHCPPGQAKKGKC